MYTKAYVAIHPILTKRFTSSSPCRTMKVFRKSKFSNKFDCVCS